MKLTLLIPGLAWPDPADGADVCRDLQLPSLSRLLGLAQLTPDAQPLSAQLCRTLGLDACALAADEAASLGLGGDGSWLLAEPSHLRVDRDRALLADVGIMQLAQDEADALVVSLNDFFAADGLRFAAPQPGRWLLRLERPSGARFTPLMDALGEDVNAHLPQGEAGLQWSRWLNELQMLLYTHPVNDAREARGEPPVNNVWLWGEQRGASRPAAPRQGVLLADDATVRALGAQAGWTLGDAPYALDGLDQAAGGAGQVLLWLDALQAPAQYRDAWGWREGLLRLERDWFAPLLAALRSGRLSSLTLLCHGQAGFAAQLGRGGLWRLWRRPRALATLYPKD